MKLLKKEWALCLHPAVPVMLALALLVLIPNYPLSISFFYVTLGIFFICLSGRENHDISFTLSLPVSRRQMVRARILFACCLEGIQLLLCLLLVLLRGAFMDPVNGAGMDANIALLGEGLLVFAIFHLVFFPAWYRDIRKVGLPFVLSGIAVFLYIVLAIAATWTVPFVRDRLDTPDPAFLGDKLLFVLCAAAVYALATGLALRISVKRFEKLDLQL